ncbi:adhesive domain-containing protein [Weissella confusa]
MNKADKALGTSEQRKRMYKSKKMWVIAGISCLTLGGGVALDFPDISVDRNGVHLVQRTADAAVVDGQLFTNVETTSNATESLPVGQPTNVDFTMDASGAADVSVLGDTSREVALQVPAGTDIEAAGPIQVHVEVIGGLGTVLDPVVDALELVLTGLDTTIIKAAIGSEVIDNLNKTLDNLKNGAVTADYTVDPSEATVETLPDGSQYLSVDLDGGLGTALSQTLTKTLTDLLNTVKSISVLGVDISSITSPLIDGVLTPTITSLSSGTGNTVNKLVDAAVLGSTTVTVPTTITPDGSTSPVEVKGAIASSDAINLDLFAGVASSTDVLVDLTTAKANANAQIDALTALTDVERADYKSQVEAATSTDEIDGIVTTAQSANELAQAKLDANAAIDALTYLSDDEKAAYKQQVASATAVEDTNNVVTAATAQNLANAKTWGTGEVAGLTNLDDASKQSFTTQIQGATTTEQVEQIVTAAQTADATALADARTTATTAIDGMAYLSTAKKDDYKAKVASATDVAGVNVVVSDATDQNLANAQSWANDEITKLVNLDADAKQGYANQVSTATTVAQVEQIVADAKAADAAVVAAERTKANATIDALTYLSTEEVAGYKQDIENARTVTGVDDVVTQATAMNFENAKD